MPPDVNMNLLLLVATCISTLISIVICGCYRKTGGGLYFALPFIPLVIVSFTANESNYIPYALMLILYSTCLAYYFVVWHEHRLKTIGMSIKETLDSPVHDVLRELGNIVLKRNTFSKHMMKNDEIYDNQEAEEKFFLEYFEKCKTDKGFNFPALLSVFLLRVHETVQNFNQPKDDIFMLKMIARILAVNASIYIHTANAVHLHGINKIAERNTMCLIRFYLSFKKQGADSVSPMELVTKDMERYPRVLESALV